MSMSRIRFTLFRLVATALAIAVASCSSPSTPSTVPQPGSPPVVTVGITDASAVAFVEGRTFTYRLMATVTVVGSGISIDSVRIDLSRPDTSSWTLARGYGLRVEPGQRMSLYLDVPEIDASRPMASAIVATLEFADDSGRRTTHPFTPSLRIMDIPTVSASLVPAAIEFGQSTRLEWEAPSGSVGISELRMPAEGWPSHGAVRLTPCPGQTTFRVSAANLSGYASKEFVVTVSRAPGSWSACGNWSGTAEGTKTDSVDGVSPFTGYVTLAILQSGERLEGDWVLSRFLQDMAMGHLTGALRGNALAGTVEYDRPELAEKTTCASEVSATLSHDEQELAGTYKARCTQDGRREVAYDGRFTARRIETQPYPRLR